MASARGRIKHPGFAAVQTSISKREISKGNVKRQLASALKQERPLKLQIGKSRKRS